MCVFQWIPWLFHYFPIGSIKGHCEKNTSKIGVTHCVINEHSFWLGNNDSTRFSSEWTEQSQTRIHCLLLDTEIENTNRMSKNRFVAVGVEFKVNNSFSFDRPG